MGHRHDPMNAGVQRSEIGDVGAKPASLATSATGVMLEPKPATASSAKFFIYKEGSGDINGVAVPGGPLTKVEMEDAAVLGIDVIIRRRNDFSHQI